MKFTKFGKALLMSALSAAVVLSVTSCIQSYSVGYLYVTGTVTSQSGGNGIITGFEIDHNTGQLNALHGLPVSSGGANPVRAVLIVGSRFLYVLNRGTNAAGGSVCTSTNPCSGSNITQFAVGGNGVLSAQQTFYTQGINPFRLVADSTGRYLYALDHDSPDNTQCHLALGAGVNACGDVTAYSIDQTTGRLQLIVNAQVTAANGASLTYFPVPANPIDFVENGGYLLTLVGTPAAGDSVFPYTSASNGQLTISLNSSDSIGSVHNATAIVAGGSYLYVLDNEAPTPNPTSAASQILAFTVGSGGALQAQNSGIVADDPTLSNPNYLVVESKGKYLYLANQAGNSANANSPNGGIAGYVIDQSQHTLSFTDPSTFGTGSGPQCIVEDPSDQFIYTANFTDSTVTGRVVDPNSGVLNGLRVNGGTFALSGQPTWCLVDGRTN
jgi:6-phosphogluconolactonase (cycloisomerase 2 family)